jgi:hypothetical protein
MPRRMTRRYVLALAFALIPVTTACTRNDVAGPSEEPRPALETQGSGNKP